jgi:hypothetical protein
VVTWLSISRPVVHCGRGGVEAKGVMKPSCSPHGNQEAEIAREQV